MFRNRRFNLSIFLILSFIILTGRALCQSDDSNSFIDFPQKGVLAANGSLPAGSLALPQLPMGLDGRKVPFNAALKPGQDKNWYYSVTNNGNKRLKIVVDILQFNSDREQISSSSAHLRIKPNEAAEGKTAIQSKAQGCVVFLKEWSWEK